MLVRLLAPKTRRKRRGRARKVVARVVELAMRMMSWMPCSSRVYKRIKPNWKIKI